MTAGALHQLLHTLSYGDAISGEVLALQRWWREQGRDSQIYAINVHPKLRDRAQSYQELPVDFNGELVFHYSLGSPLNDLYRGLRSARRTLIFHNLTPAAWFQGVNPRIVGDIEQGAAELPLLCAASDRLLADSAFNAATLHELGFAAEVLELPVDAEKWALPANSGIAALLRAAPGMQVLHVGRLAPNKCVEDVIKTFYFLHHKIDRRSRLWLVGIDIDTELYSLSLKRLVAELGLEEAVVFAGCMSDCELKALYQGATVYLGLSEHEGFCVPLIEAMYFGLPVVAYGVAAVPGTMGAGGIVVYEKNHALLAELIQEVALNFELRERLIAAGRRRAAALSYENFTRRVRELFG